MGYTGASVVPSADKSCLCCGSLGNVSIRGGVGHCPVLLNACVIRYGVGAGSKCEGLFR